MNPLATSRALHERTRAMVGAFERGGAMPETFDSLAVDIARFQAERIPGYARLCAARYIDPSAIRTALDAPAVPADAFRASSVFAFAPGDASVTFRTSGTTIGTRGAHPIRDIGTYDRGALAFARAAFFRDTGDQASVLVIGPSSTEAPDSSLAHMCTSFARTLGATDESAFFVREGELQKDALRTRVASLGRRASAIVLATSFALVHLLDALGGERLQLPPRSRVMLTGGFKGRSREVSAIELRRAVALTFGVSERAVVGEYGMTELSSQFWEALLIDDEAPFGTFVEPPWARVIPVDPETLTPVADGAVGIARIEDLANVDSAFAILANDRVRRTARGFELLGRAPGAIPRGCSIALDEILSSSEGSRYP